MNRGYGLMKRKKFARGAQMRGVVAAVLLSAASVPVSAQWLTLPTPGLPRLPDGKPDLAAPAPRTAEGKPDFSGLWHNERGIRYYNNIAIDLTEADVAPAVHAAYVQRNLEYGKDSMETQCMPLGPGYLTTPYHEFRIIQTPALIAFLYDDGTHREVFMDGRELEADPNPTWMGYSVGHWEGDELVVESNGYTDRSWLDFGGHGHTEALRITERYTRSTVGQFELHVRMLDPAAYFEPIEIDMQVGLMPDTEMIEFVCETHRGSAERMALTQAADVAEVSAETLARYAGTYDVFTAGNVDIVEVTADDTSLYLSYKGEGNELLIPLSSTRFSWSGSIVEFTPSSDGEMNISFDYAEGQDRGTRRD